MANGEIIIVPFHSSGHIFPATELARRLASRDYRITLLLPSAPSSSASLHPLIQIVEHSMPHPPGPHPPPSCPPLGPHSGDDRSPFRDLLAERFDAGDPSPSLVCAIVDVMSSQLLDVCKEFGVPAVSLFTSSACSTAMDHAVSKLSTADLGSGGAVVVPGLPEEMAVTAADLMHQGPPPPPFGPCHLLSGEDATGAHHDCRPSPLFRPPHPPMPGHQGRGPPPPPSFQQGHGGAPPPSPRECHGRGPPPPFDLQHRGGGGPPPPRPATPGGPQPPFRLGEGGGPTPPRGGGPPQGLADADGAVALLFNTCGDLEQPFLDYIANEAKKPVWGVGPLLPSQFWSAAGSVLHDDAIRSKDRGASAAVTEADVLQFLDSKPRGSVIYASFGSLVVPSDAELAELASALEESSRPFIWVLQPGAMGHDAAGRPMERGEGTGYFPERLAERAGGRGLVIHGWAPQLLILSHPATGGFLTHCGWNSTVEALGRGVPVLAWPVHGDQVWNTRLVTRRLGTGLAIKDAEGAVTKVEVAEGIERLMADGVMRARAAALARELFAGGFPASSEAAMDALLEFAAEKPHKK